MTPEEYLSRIYAGEVLHTDKLSGYSDDEIETIEAMLNISVQGELRELLRHVGRCSGHLFYESLVLYGEISSDMVAFQKDCLDDLIEENLAKAEDMDGYFMFSSENEGYAYWLKTKQMDFERVYMEDDEGLKDTGKTLLEYLKYLAAVAEYDKHFGVLVEGDMLAQS